MTKEEKQAADAAMAAAMDTAMEEFFARGGEIQLLEPNQSGRVEGESVNRWAKKKPAAEPLPIPTEAGEE